MESVVPGRSLTAQIGGLVWLEDESTESEAAVASGDRGEWVRAFGFNIDYGHDDYGAFEYASGGSESLANKPLQPTSGVGTTE